MNTVTSVVIAFMLGFCVAFGLRARVLRIELERQKTSITELSDSVDSLKIESANDYWSLLRRVIKLETILSGGYSERNVSGTVHVQHTANAVDAVDGKEVR